VTLAQFYLDEYSPVKGPRMAAFGVEGSGNRWRHSTMDSETADRLIAEGVEELVRSSVSLGSEYAISERMSLGMSFADCKRQYELTKTLFSPRAEPQERTHARAELRRIFLETMPAAIASEQRVLGGGP